jgi:hypothetical protein
VTPDALRARLAALRVAGEELRRRPVRDVIDALAAVIQRWRDPDGPERRALERELPAATGFSPENVREGLARGLAPWSGDALRSAALVKSAARDPITAPLVASSIAAIDPQLARCLEVVAFAGADAACMEVFLGADCVVATGSNATIASVAARIRPHQRLLRHGHRLSVALLGPAACDGAALGAAARGLALDTALWDQQGCLSPIAVYVAGGATACPPVGDALARELDAIGRALPRGTVDAEAAALFAHERAGAELRAAAGQQVTLHMARDASWAVVCEPDAAPRRAPLNRFVRVHPVARPEQLGAVLGPLAAQLAGVAIAGFGPAEPQIAEQLRALGASRVCAPGELQSPPLDWPRDGLPLLASLAR